MLKDLNVKKIFIMFKELHPTFVVPYETYRWILNLKFNISFGYSRTDMCITCDALMTNMKTLPLKKNNEIKNLRAINVFHEKKHKHFTNIRIVQDKKPKKQRRW